MGLFSKKKKININDMPIFMCDVVLNTTWGEMVGKIEDIYGYSIHDTKFGQFRATAVTSGYCYAFIRLNFISCCNIDILESLILKSKEMFVEQFKLRTLFVFDDNDKSLMEKLLKQSYNNAIQSIKEAKIVSISEMPKIVDKQYLLDLYGDANLSFEQLNKVLDEQEQLSYNVIKKLFTTTNNISQNIKITKKGATDSGYVPYAQQRKKSLEMLNKLDSATVEEKAELLKKLINK